MIDTKITIIFISIFCLACLITRATSVIRYNKAECTLAYDKDTKSVILADSKNEENDMFIFDGATIVTKSTLKTLVEYYRIHLKYKVYNTLIVDAVVSEDSPGEITIQQGRYISAYMLESDKIYWLGHNMTTRKVHWYIDGIIPQEEREDVLAWDIEPYNLEKIIGSFKYYYPYATDDDTFTRIRPGIKLYMELPGISLVNHSLPAEKTPQLSYERCRWRWGSKTLGFILYDNQVKLFIAQAPGSAFENWIDMDRLILTNNGNKYELVMVHKETSNYLTLRKVSFDWNDYEPYPINGRIFWNTWYRRITYLDPENENDLYECQHCGRYIDDKTITIPRFYVDYNGILITHYNAREGSGDFAIFSPENDGWYSYTFDKRKYKLMKHKIDGSISLFPVANSEQ